MENPHKSPFSLYDFLGYFIPGALSCYLFVLVFGIESINWLNLEFFRGLRVFDQSVAFIILSYVLGHAINYFSSLTIERYSIWNIGYPSRYILGIKPECYFKRMKDIKEKTNDPESEKQKKQQLKEFWISLAWRLGLLIVILPLSLIDFVIGNLLGFKRHYTNPVDNSLKSIIEERTKEFKKHHGYDGGAGKGDYFRPIWHYYYEKFGAHSVKLDNYVALYGFTRSMSFIFCSFSWLIAVFKYDGDAFRQYVVALLFFVFLSYVFYLAFVKFYRRFTLEGLMCLVIDKDLVQVDSVKYQYK